MGRNVVQANLFRNNGVMECVEVTGSCVGGGSWRQDGNEVAAYNRVLVEFFYKKLMAVTNPTYLDVGANTGAFTLLAKYVPGARVFAIEPQKEVLPWLRENIELNGFGSRVVVIPHAAWSETEQVSLCPYADQHGQSRLQHAFSHGGGGSPYMVQGMTLEDMDGHYDFGWVDFIKLDVEGAEKHVLGGALDLLREYRPGILMEWWPPHCQHFGYHPKEIDEMLKLFGYHKEQVSSTFVYYYQEVKNE